MRFIAQTHLASPAAIRCSAVHMPTWYLYAEACECLPSPDLTCIRPKAARLPLFVAPPFPNITPPPSILRDGLAAECVWASRLVSQALLLLALIDRPLAPVCVSNLEVETGGWWSTHDVMSQ